MGNDDIIKADRSKSQNLESSDHLMIAPLASMALMESVKESAARHAYSRSDSNKHAVKQSILVAQHEFLDSHQSSSMSTIFAITNTMVGSVCLVAPQSFLDYGIISSFVVMIVLSFVQYKTCSIIVVHQKNEETDLEQMIKRILNKKWVLNATAFRLASGSLLFIVGLVYFLLINSTLYPILVFIFMKTGFTNYASPADGARYDIVNRFSIQWLAIIIFFPCCLLLLYKDISKILKLAHFGIVALISYGLFVVYIFIKNISSSEFSEQASQIVWFSWNLSQPAGKECKKHNFIIGQFALAFMIHNSIGEIIKTNKVKENNVRDLGLSYALTTVIYGLIGICGSIGILGKAATKPSTILDYFQPDDVAVLIIEALYLVHLISTFPIFNFVSKHQILNAFWDNCKAPTVVYWGYSVLFITVCLAAQLLEFNPGLVISFDGAVCGFLLIYIIPISLHMSCYHGEPKQRTKSKSKVDEILDVQVLQKQLLESNKSVKSKQSCGTSSKYECNDHPNKNWVSKPMRMMGYGVFIVIGLINMGIQFYQLFGG